MINNSRRPQRRLREDKLPRWSESEWTDLLDVLGGTGKGKNQGAGKVGPDECSVSRGKGHNSYNCLTIRGSDNKMSCRVCHRIGHAKRQCPTAHAELKGVGKGKGDMGKGDKKDDGKN